ncbi:hypothetical protein B4O99_14270 [Shewanella xiamenensis]|uniref:hypothetical protein n=1 Tax=Shewanella xiamenensis TaxID=332186 RepID=UPI001C4E58F9|nr:hypothetical protein [Shewanella xiamenensis]MBW0280683.1 hypothetical protein [Shewanella xiamenensis]
MDIYQGLTANQIEIIKAKKERCMNELAEDIRYLSSDISNALGQFEDFSFIQQRIACFMAGVPSEPYTENSNETGIYVKWVNADLMTQEQQEQIATATVELELISLSAQLNHYIESMAARMRLELVAA